MTVCENIAFFIFNVFTLFMWITSIRIMMGEGMILSFLATFKNYLLDHKSSTNRIIWYACKPIFICSSCMPSVHGLLITITTGLVFHVPFDFLGYVLTAVCTVPLCYLFTEKIVE